MPNQFKLDELLNRNLIPYSLEKFNFLATTYAKIRYYDTGGDKPVLLTAPDGPCFLEHFEEYIQKAKINWRVVILDMPGFGESYPRNAYNHSFESATIVLKELADHLSLKDITLSLSCGNGFYGIYFAKRYPSLIKKLVLLQTPGFEGMRPWFKASVPLPIKIPFIGQLLVHSQRLKIPQIWFKAALPKNSAHLKPWSDLSVSRIKKSCCNCLASVVQGLTNMSEAPLKGVTVPVVMIWGKKDFSHRYTNQETLLDIIPHAQIIVWYDCGHFPELEQTERYLEVIK